MSDRTILLSSTSGRNFLEDQSSDNPDLSPSPGIQYVQQVLFDLKANQEVRQEALRIAQQQQGRIKQEVAEVKQIAKMQQFLDSGDPILVAEALAWAQVNPGVLKSNLPLLDLLPESTSALAPGNPKAELD